MNRSWLGVFFVAVVASGNAGCGGGTPVYPVVGKVTFSDGKPVSNGVIFFEQLESNPVPAYGTIAADGSYSVTMGEEGGNPGAPAGEYKIVISGDGVNKKYGSPMTTDLSFKVEPKDNQKDFQVSK